MIKNMFFDFDGVIVESTNIKTEGFYKLYIAYGNEIANQVVNHHKKNMGVSRYEKIEWCHREFLGIELNKEEIIKLSNQYSEIVIESVINAPLVAGVLEFMKMNSDKFNYFLITATPTHEIKKILEKRMLNNYFKEAFGSPESKSYWIKHILSNYQINKKECCFLGDSLSDYNAAKENSIKFGLRKTSDNTSICMFPYISFCFNNFLELQMDINSILL